MVLKPSGSIWGNLPYLQTFQRAAVYDNVSHDAFWGMRCWSLKLLLWSICCCDVSRWHRRLHLSWEWASLRWLDLRDGEQTHWAILPSAALTLPISQENRPIHLYASCKLTTDSVCVFLCMRRGIWQRRQKRDYLKKNLNEKIVITELNQNHKEIWDEIVCEWKWFEINLKWLSMNELLNG